MKYDNLKQQKFPALQYDCEQLSACSKQSGAVLFISLIMLLLLTIIGISSMKTTVIEEKMVNNMRNHDLAFQAAESALRDAEQRIANMVNVTGFYGGSSGAGSIDGLYSAYDENTLLPDMEAVITTPATWTSDTNSIAATTIPGTATAPRYIIQHTQHVVPEDSTLSLGSYGQNKAGSEIDYFKVTARGTGGVDEAQVIIQTQYGMKF